MVTTNEIRLNEVRGSARQTIYNKFQRITRRFRKKEKTPNVEYSTDVIPSERTSKKDSLAPMLLNTRYLAEMENLGYDLRFSPRPVVYREYHYSHANIDFFNELDVQSGDVPTDNASMDIISLIEDAAWCGYLIHRNPTKRGILEAAITFAKLRTPKGLTVSVYQSDLLKKFSEIFKMNTEELEAESGDFLYVAKQSLGCYKDIIASPIFKKLYRCLMYAVSFNLFEAAGIKMEKFGYGNMEKAILKRKYFNKSDFVECLFDTVVFILEKGAYVYRTGDLKAFIHSGSSYVELHDKCNELVRKSKVLNNSELHGFTESQFYCELDEAIEKLESIYRNSYGLDKIEKNAIQVQLNMMKTIRDDTKSLRATREPRDMPFGILLCGDSGIGKSTLTEYIFQFFGKCTGLKTEQIYKYTHNYFAKHWNNFKTSCWCIVMDDVAAENPALGDNSSVKEIIQVMNPVPYCPEQAALEDKGRTPCRAKLVIATTNVEHLNAFHYFSYPSAVQRRFPFVVKPTVKEEYKNSQGMLDSSLVDDSSAYKDLWTFDVYKIIPQKIADPSKMKSLATKKVVLEGANQQEFFMWLRDAITAFQDNNKRVKEGLSTLEKAQNCHCCNLPDQMCLSAQTNDIEFYGAILPTMIFKLFDPVISWFKRIMMFLFFTFYVSICVDKTSLRYQELCIWVARVYNNPRNWKRMGDKVKGNLKIPVIFAGVLVAVLAARKAYNVFTVLKAQGNLSEKMGTEPEKEESKTENVWYKNEYTLTPMEVSRQSASAKSMSFMDFKKLIAHNCVHIRVIYPDKKDLMRPSKMLCLGGHVYMTNNHNIPNLTSKARALISQSYGTNVSDNIEVYLEESDMVRVPEQDVVFITLRQIPPKKNVAKYFLSEKVDGPLKGETLGRNVDGSLTGLCIDNIKKSRNHRMSSDLTGPLIRDVWLGWSDGHSERGDCGSILMSETSFGYVLCGIHFARFREKGVVLHSISKEFVEEHMRNLDKYTVEAGDYSLISSVSGVREVGPLNKKSVFRFMDKGVASVHGSFQGFRGTSKSTVEVTPMAYHLPDYKIKYGPPVMGSYIPWRIAALDLVEPITKLSTSVLQKCVDSYKNKIFKLSQEEYSRTLRVLDDFSTLNGQAGVKFIDKMNRNTSAGNPWKKSKKHFLQSIPPVGQNLDPVKIDLEIDNRIEEILTNYLEGRCSHPNFCAHLKDEPVSFKKVKMGKTRVFTGAPMDWSLVVRKFLLSCTKLIQENKYVFEAGPGTIAQSLEWHEMYNYITTHGSDRIVAGDYKAFDKKMSPKEILAAFDILHDMCEHSGNYNEDELKIIRCIAEDTAFPLVDYNGDLVQFYGSNPSGNPLTVILNSLVNSLRMRYIYHELNPLKECESFNDNVSLMTYGDDNIMSVSKNADWFNHTAIANEFEKLDIVYTMADKEAESVPFISMNEASFLKRSWRHDEEMGCYLAPLEHDSIEKMLTVWTRSKSIPAEAQSIAVIGTAVQEYFFYGRSIFEDKREMLQELVKTMGLDNWVQEATFPTFDDLKQRFFSSSEGIDIQC